jgi:hypothetical protein
MDSIFTNLLLIEIPKTPAEWFILIGAIIIYILPLLLLTWLVLYLVRRPNKNNAS